MGKWHHVKWANAQECGVRYIKEMFWVEMWGRCQQQGYPAGNKGRGGRSFSMLRSRYFLTYRYLIGQIAGSTLARNLVSLKGVVSRQVLSGRRHGGAGRHSPLVLWQEGGVMNKQPVILVQTNV